MKYYFVYILESEISSDRFYVGFTKDLKERLRKHNAKECAHTSKYAPWIIKNFFAFDSKEKAIMFEIYLKTSSGRAFTKKHF